MSTRFAGKVALITGAASGIGRATAIKLASDGAKLALSDINAAGLEETNKQCGNGHYTEVSSVADSKACQSFVDNAAAKLGRLDFVFNCAGVNPTAYALTETSDEYWDLLVNTNLKGTYAISRAAIPHLERSAASPPPGPSIVNVTSIMGVSVSPNYAIYCATKHGIVGFTRALALELGPRQIRVNAVAPGYIDTPTNAGVVAGGEAVREQEKQVAMGRMGTAGEIADVVAFLFR